MFLAIIMYAIVIIALHLYILIVLIGYIAMIFKALIIFKWEHVTMTVEYILLWKVMIFELFFDLF